MQNQPFGVWTADRKLPTLCNYLKGGKENGFQPSRSLIVPAYISSFHWSKFTMFYKNLFFPAPATQPYWTTAKTAPLNSVPRGRKSRSHLWDICGHLPGSCVNMTTSFQGLSLSSFITKVVPQHWMWRLSRKQVTILRGCRRQAKLSSVNRMQHQKEVNSKGCILKCGQEWEKRVALTKAQYMFLDNTACV